MFFIAQAAVRHSEPLGYLTSISIAVAAGLYAVLLVVLCWTLGERGAQPSKQPRSNSALQRCTPGVTAKRHEFKLTVEDGDAELLVYHHTGKKAAVRYHRMTEQDLHRLYLILHNHFKDK